ncbi:hypothetical protein CR513_39693, partial [Mucuna pruriens]
HLTYPLFKHTRQPQNRYLVNKRNNKNKSCRCGGTTFRLRQLELYNLEPKSFDHPSDTLLPGLDFKTGLNTSLTANPEEVTWKGPTEYYRSGPMEGVDVKFPSSPGKLHDCVQQGLVYLTYRTNDKSVISRIVLNQTLYVRQRLKWIRDSQTWSVSFAVANMQVFRWVRARQIDWNHGCRDKNKNGFGKFSNVKPPDTTSKGAKNVLALQARSNKA